MPEDLLQAENISAVDQVAHAEGVPADVRIKVLVYWQPNINYPTSAHDEEAFAIARKAGRALTLEQVVCMTQEVVTDRV